MQLLYAVDHHKSTCWHASAAPDMGGLPLDTLANSSALPSATFSKAVMSAWSSKYLLYTSGPTPALLRRTLWPEWVGCPGLGGLRSSSRLVSSFCVLA